MEEKEVISLPEKISHLIKAEYQSLKSESSTFNELKKKLSIRVSEIAWCNGPQYKELLETEFNKLFFEDVGRLSANSLP